MECTIINESPTETKTIELLEAHEKTSGFKNKAECIEYLIGDTKFVYPS
jgi:hypothetical protein